MPLHSRVRRSWLPAAFLLALACALTGPHRSASAQDALFVNSTGDPSFGSNQCEEDADDCSLRGALERARLLERGAIIRACFDPAEVEGAMPCPPGKRPLRTSDPGYDAATGKWTIRLRSDVAFNLSEPGTIVDFRQGLDWESPADNRIIVLSTVPETEAAFRFTAENNVLAGIEFRGEYTLAAVYLPGGVFGEPAAGNQIGPGNIFAGIPRGAGIKLSGDIVYENRIFGNWCGITGDGTVVDPVFEDCVQVDQGAHDNIIGDRALENRNVFAASTLGSGVIVEGDTIGGPQTDGNEIRGNWFGMNFTGTERVGLKSGIQLVFTPSNTRIIGNVISGNENAGIALFDRIEGVLIEDNIIGGDPSDEGCVPNIGYGIQLQGGPRDTMIRGNSIRCNNSGGVLMAGPNTISNTVTETTFHENGGRAIDLIQSANGGLGAPALASATREEVRGTACAGCRVEVFSDVGEEAAWYEGSATAGPDGAFTFTKAEGLAGDFVTATATDEEGNTSPFAASLRVGESGPTATATVPPTEPTPGTPTPSPTVGPDPTDTPEGPQPTIYLPWTGRNAESGD